MYIHEAAQKRRGVTVVETAVIIGTFLFLVLGMLDLGVGVFRHHILSNAARHAARKAIVRGSLAPNRDSVNTWGPPNFTNPYENTADQSDDIADTIRPYLVGLDPANVTIRMEWITSNEQNGRNRVTVTMTTEYRPIVMFMFGPNASFTQRASSTMLMAH